VTPCRSAASSAHDPLDSMSCSRAARRLQRLVRRHRFCLWRINPVQAWKVPWKQQEGDAVPCTNTWSEIHETCRSESRTEESALGWVGAEPALTPTNRRTNRVADCEAGLASNTVRPRVAQSVNRIYNRPAPYRLFPHPQRPAFQPRRRGALLVLALARFGPAPRLRRL
jgi:hypothetical protein